MKRKLALLLAAVMVIAALPMNVFAATGNSVSHTTNVENKTIFYEAGVTPSASVVAGDIEGNTDIKYWITGSELRIIFTGPIGTGLGGGVVPELTLTLENARWNFRQVGTYSKAAAAGSPTPYVETANATLPYEVDVTAIPTLNLTASEATAIGITTAVTIDSAHTLLGAFLGHATVQGLTIGTTTTVTNAAIPTFELLTEYDTAKSGTTHTIIPGAADPTWSSTPLSTTAFSHTPDMAEDHYARYAGLDAITFAGVNGLAAAITAGSVDAIVTASGPNYAVNFVKGATGTFVTNANYEFAFATANYPLGGTPEVYNGNGAPIDPITSGFNGVQGTATTVTASDSEIITAGIAAQFQASFDVTKGLLKTIGTAGTSSAHYVYERFEEGFAAGAGELTGEGTGRWKPYTLTVMTQGNNRVAQIKIDNFAGYGSGDGIRIPLAIVTNADGDYRIRVEQVAGTGIASGNLLIGAKVTGKTNATVDSHTVRRNEIAVGRLKISEVRAGSIFSNDPWMFEIKAPRGFEFAYDTLAQNHVIGSHFGLYTEGGLKWADGSTGTVPNAYAPAKTGIAGVMDSSLGSLNRIKAEWKYKTDLTDTSSHGRETDFTSIVFWIDGGVFERSVTTTGSLYVNGLTLIPEDDENIPFGKEIFFDLKNFTSAGTTAKILTEQAVKIGIPRDYDITLTRVKDEIPELFAGRYEEGVLVDPLTGDYSDVIIDEEHQAAKVKFAEVVADAWWAQRNTVFTLPSEVRFLKVDFDEDTVDKIINSASNRAVDRLLQGSQGTPANDGIYYNSRKRFGAVTINDNTMTLTNLAVESSAKATFQFDIWLSIQADYSGEIALTLDRKALQYCDRDDDIECVIATAIVPAKITTTITEAKVGYQYVAVADFYLTENKAGGFVQGKKAYVTVTDEISIDMGIANSFTWNYEEGNLKVKDVTTRSILGVGGGMGVGNGSQVHIEFTIDKASTVASELSFKNVEVKIDRYVPFSNTSYTEDRGINLFLWGPAVANNYYYLHKGPSPENPNNTYNPNDLFPVAGVKEKYINIATLATDSNQAGFVNNVIVTIGSKAYTINGEAAELDVAPYISPESNSTMVPVRFIANALGLSEFAVSWDDATKTATVDANNRIISFTVGSTYYTVNGTPIPMVSPDGLPVAMEITEGRSFVPFRALGDAFGIPVEWHPETNSAEYNKPVMQ